MTTDDNNQAGTVAPEATEGAEPAEETISLSKSEYEKLNQSLGSLKRELKDLRKAKEDSETPSKESKAEESSLLQKLEKQSLRLAGVTHPDDVELARNTAKKWNMDIDDVLDDEDFKSKLKRQQDQRSNEDATSNIRGNKSGTSAKDTAEYWQAKGTPPTPDQVPDGATRRKIIRSMRSNAQSKPQFYNQ